jgi:hypothetical protein
MSGAFRSEEHDTRLLKELAASQYRPTDLPELVELTSEPCLPWWYVVATLLLMGISFALGGIAVAVGWLIAGRELLMKLCTGG